MIKVYVIEKKYYKTLYLIEQDILVEEINDSYSIYEDIIKLYSNVELELEEDEIYRPFRIIASDKNISKDMQYMQCKYIEKITKFKNIKSVVEKKEDNNYIVFYTNSLPLYVKNYDRERLTTHINTFKENDILYGEGKTTEIKLREAGNNFDSLAEIHYGKEELSKKDKHDIRKKEIISERDLNKYLDLKEKNGFYEYKDMEDIKNILRIENNFLPGHKLLKTDKFLLLQLNLYHNLVRKIPEYNKILADNELLFSDKNMLKEMSQLFYRQAEKHDKTIFDNEESAICFFLSLKLKNFEAILVSEKDQWIVYHKDSIDTLDDSSCKEEIIKILQKKELDTSHLGKLSLKELANLFIHDGELILSDEKNIVYLDHNDKNLPLHIIVNSGLHHHGYYDNGIWKGVTKKEDYEPVLPKLVNFTFSSIDNINHVEVTVNCDDRKKIIDDCFYLPVQYYDTMNSQLKKLFTYGLMLDSFAIVKWQKEKELDIDSVIMPSWITDVSKEKEKELFKFLLQF